MSNLTPDFEIFGKVMCFNKDYLEVMKALPSQSIDMVFSDPPYGVTYADFDKSIDIKLFWYHVKRIIKPKGAIVLYSQQPFTSLLINSNPEWFRCEWIWDKANPANFANANRQPLKVHENIIVFASGQTIYNPQKTQGKPNHKQGKSKINKSETRLISGRVEDDLSGLKFPKSIVTFPKHSSQLGLHPTQKLQSLCEFFIKTYSNEGNLILDCFMGSATTGVACLNTNRNFIGVELDKNYFDIGIERIKNI